MSAISEPAARTRYTRGAYQFVPTTLPMRTTCDAERFFRQPTDTPGTAWGELIDELLGMRSLQEDWDGNGAVAPPAVLVDGALSLAQHLRAIGTPPADRVVAGVNGTIHFEWYTPSGYQEIEVTSPTEAECRVVGRGSDVMAAVRLGRYA